MLKKRIIPCLDIRNGRTVKGINFIDLQDAGDPVELAARYCKDGADELVVLDITATIEKRKSFYDLIKNIASAINIPITVGGGINSIEDVGSLLESGADKISINSAASRNPILITQLADQFGSQCIVVAMDIKKQTDNRWYIYLDGGRTATVTLATDWTKEATRRGAGEILLTSMDHDGTRNGFALDITNEVSSMVSVPVIASGGAGTIEHFKNVFETGRADAALAAGIFHSGELTIPKLKEYLNTQNIPVRL